MFCSPRTKKKRSRHSEIATKLLPDTEISSVTGDISELSPLFTYSEVAYCIFCKRTSAPLVKLPSGIFINLTGYVHEICLKHKGCCECGVLGLCYRCTVKDCQRLIHSWCAQGLHGNSNFCDLHSNTHKKKESSRLPFIKSISRKIISSSFWEKDYKDKDSPSSLCNGYIFWYLLNLEYFPPGYDLSCFPSFPLCSQFELEYESSTSPNYLKKMIAKVSGDLEQCQSSNSFLISQIMSKLQRDSSKKSDLISDLADRNTVNDDFLKLMEHKQLNKVEKICEICEETGEEDLMTCHKCLGTVHGRCYKVPFVDEFLCEACEFYGGPIAVNCALCSVRSGVFKKTLHVVKDILFPQYVAVGKSDTKQPIWVHSFCALHTVGVIFRNNGVDLSGIDTTRMNIYCEICKAKEGFCLQCNFSSCCSNFHANCGRDLFVSTKANEKKLFCSLHKPVKLRKMLETRQKQVSEDIYKFCKAMEKYFAKMKAQAKVLKKKKKIKSKNSFGRIFTADEDLLLEYKIQQFLYRLNISQKKPFTLNINLKASTRCSRVNISRPHHFTLIAPYVILEENLSIEGRNTEECFKRYQDTLYNKLKNEMLLLGNRLSIYQGKDLPPPKHSTKPKKRPSEGKFKASSDTYCICSQPYYYEIPWVAEWSQDQWEEKIRENEMIECTKCEKWFHLKCVGYEGSLDKAQQDENWKCGTCDEKKVEKLKFVDRNSVVTEPAQGVVTRRGTKIL